MQSQEPQSTKSANSSESLRILASRWKDGTFKEILEDWKWIFTYSKR